MKKHIICFLQYILLMCAINASAQKASDTTHYWKNTALAGLNFNQASLSNWQGGGQNTIAVAGFLHCTAIYTKGNKTWFNKLDAAYGVVQVGGKNEPFEKSDDELKIATAYRQAINKNFSYAISGDFKTNFAPGYKYDKDSKGRTVPVQKLSQFMAPGYLILGAGFAYKPSEIFYANVSPLAGRFTFVLNDSMAKAGVYGVPAGQKLRAEIGESIKLGLKWPFMKNVTLESNLELFGNYKHVQQQVVDWSNNLSFKVNSLFSANAGTRLIYDQDISIKRDNGSIGPAVQFKEVIAIGLQYKLL